MKDFEDYKEQAQDFVDSTSYRHFEHFSQKVDRFLNLLQRYKQTFQRRVATLIPQVRGTGKEERELAEVLTQHAESPFSRVQVRRWINLRQSEDAALKSFIQMLRPIEFAANRGEHITYIVNNREVISLNLYFPQIADPFLTTLNGYLNGRNSTTVNFGQSSLDTSTLYILRTNIRDIMQYQEANKDSSIAFVYSIQTPMNPSQQSPSAEIKGFRSQGRHQYQETFIPPRSPHSLEEMTEDNGQGVTLQWQAPEYGSDFIDYYQIVVTERGHRLGQPPIEYTYRTTSNETSFRIAEPENTVPYSVTVHGVCRIGRTGKSEPLHHSGVQVRLVGGAEVCSPRRARSGRIEV